MQKIIIPRIQNNDHILICLSKIIEVLLCYFYAQLFLSNPHAYILGTEVNRSCIIPMYKL